MAFEIEPPPPPPFGEKGAFASYVWQQWFNRLWKFLSSFTGTITGAQNEGAGSGVFDSATSTADTLFFKSLAAGTGITITDSGTGTLTLASSSSGGSVTSVALSLPSSTFAISGSPVTTTGTLTGTFATQAANIVFAGPASGSAATPTWRALVPADLPVATTSTFGTIMPDGTTITVAAGVISAVGGGSGFDKVFENTFIPPSYYTILAPFSGAFTTNLLGNNLGSALIVPIFVHRPMTLRANVFVGAGGGAGTTMICAIYAQDPTSGLPGALLHGFAPLSTATSGVVVTSTDTYAIAAGTYWLFTNTSATGVTLRGISPTTFSGAPLLLGFISSLLTGGTTGTGAYDTPVTYSTTPPSSLATATLTSTAAGYRVFFSVTNQL